MLESDLAIVKSAKPAATVMPAWPSEQALINHLPDCTVQSALVVSLGRAQLASVLLEKNPQARVTGWFLDLHQASLARASLVASQIHIICAADLPDERFDFIAIAVSVRGEAELTRDLLQQAHERLQAGGTLITAVDNPRDQWLREQLEPMFDKVTCIDAEHSRVYIGRKSKPLRKLRNFQAEVVCRDDDHLIKVITRPGVFAHRQIDPGARQLLLSMDIQAGERVLDLGCGSGVLALAACLRADQVTAYAVDSNARAVECVQRSAELNDILNLETRLNSDGQLGLDGSIDVVLCNPPYYSDFEIAEKMIRTATQALRSGGAALIVNKQPQWYEERLPQSFVDVEVFPSGKYWVACGRKP